MTHIILTGERHVGKTTLARRVTEALQIAPGGFVTRLSDRDRLDRTLLIGDGVDMRPVAEYQDNYPSVVYADVFAGYGCELLARPARLIYMDELGRLEGRAQPFRDAVLRAFDGDVPVLAIVQKVDRASWLDRVLAHPKVRVVQVTIQNRDALADELVLYYANALQGR